MHSTSSEKMEEDQGRSLCRIAYVPFIDQKIQDFKRLDSKLSAQRSLPRDLDDLTCDSRHNAIPVQTFGQCHDLE